MTPEQKARLEALKLVVPTIPLTTEARLDRALGLSETLADFITNGRPSE